MNSKIKETEIDENKSEEDKTLETINRDYTTLYILGALFLVASWITAIITSENPLISVSLPIVIAIAGATLAILGGLKGIEYRVKEKAE